MNAQTFKTYFVFVRFFAYFVLVYLLVVSILSKVSLSDFTILQICTKNRLWGSPGGFGQSLERFRDIEAYKNIDVLFIGSSHAYRSFDPRIFSKYGLTSFNMGSPSQTPLNSYYLLKRYFSALNPRLVIYEAYFKIFEVDGLESFYDLCTNLSFSKEILEMVSAIRHPHAINTLVSTYLARIGDPLREAKQQTIEGETYVSGGYVESYLLQESTDFGKTRHIKISEVQMEYFTKIFSFLRERDCKVVLVMQPMPKEYLETIANYDISSQKISQVARSFGIQYFDFNDMLTLDTQKDFKDYQHLNSYGVTKFNEALIDILFSKKIVS